MGSSWIPQVACSRFDVLNCRNIVLLHSTTYRGLIADIKFYISSLLEMKPHAKKAFDYVKNRTRYRDHEQAILAAVSSNLDSIIIQVLLTEGIMQ